MNVIDSPDKKDVPKFGKKEEHHTKFFNKTL